MSQSEYDGLILFQAAAQLIKDSLDKQYGLAWHCVIGKGFSYDITAQVSQRSTRKGDVFDICCEAEAAIEFLLRTAYIEFFAEIIIIENLFFELGISNLWECAVLGS